MNKRLIENIENKLEDSQMGFHSNRSTIDNIFIIRQIFEKSHEYNIDLYNIFVDYTHAFDSVYRNNLIECLKKFDVPDKLIRLIALTLIQTRSPVKINSDFTEEFIVECRVKQGDPVSATLFSLVIDTILKQMGLRGNITTHLKQCTVYADDIMLTTRTKQSLIDTCQKLKEISAQYGLIANGQKTKYIRCTRKNYNLEELQINLMHLEQVQSYKYLRSAVNSDNSIEEEIRNRITLGNEAYHANQFLFKSRLVSKKLKMKMYWSIIRPIVTYVCETWVLNETIKNKLIYLKGKCQERSLVLQ